MPDEDSGRMSIASRIKSHLKDASFFCKIIELVFCVISAGLIIDSFNKILIYDMDEVGVVFVGVCGYILINAVLLLGHLLGETMPKKMALMFSVVGAVLCFASGILLIREWSNFPNNLISQYLEQYSAQMIASGFFAIVAALIFAVDVYFIHKYQ